MVMTPPSTETPGSTTTTPAVTADDVMLADPRVQELMASVTAKLETHTHNFAKAQRQLEEQRQQGTVSPQISEPITTLIGAPPYLWCDLLVAGPFQPVQPGGPFLPHRVIVAGESAVMLAVLWRNPAPLGGGPSAAQIMSAFTFQVRAHGETINTGVGVPDIVPPAQLFGPGFVNVIPLVVPTLPAPPQGDPRLLEYHITFDVAGPGPGLPPFAGFATRWFNPDLQPPFLGLPPIPPGFIEEAPVRLMIYS